MKPLYHSGQEPLRVLLRNFTYKPGWNFYIGPDGLIIEALVTDSDNPKQNIRVSFGIGIPSFVRPEFPWDRWLLDQIMTVEDHEAREFFKIDGVKVFDPHG